MPELTPEQTLLANIKLVRGQIAHARTQLNESKGYVKSAAQKAQESEIIHEAKLLAKAAFSLGPAGEPCSCCGGSGRS